MVQLKAQQIKWVVAKDGSGDYQTVQEALNHIPSPNSEPITIYIKNGVYKEKLVLDTRKDFVTLIGEDVNHTILTFDNHAGLRLPNGDTINTWSSASFFVYANDFTAKNICFQNNAGFTAGQSVALYVYGTRAFFKDCRMLGFQDVLFCSGPGAKQLFIHCYIEGTTDFIFGPATVYFDHCELHSKKNSHVTAASTPREAPFGFVFSDCRLTADSGINKVSLGRPWQPWASVAYIKCQIGSHIIPEGWNNWKNPDNEKTARFVEFENTGPGSSKETRVLWSRQLSPEEAKKYDIANVLGEWGENKLTTK